MHGTSSSSANPSGVQGICPNGWHVPSSAEWTQLTNYVRGQSLYQCNNSSNNIAKALASATNWNTSSSTCAVGNNQSANNATGFSALPAGSYGYDSVSGYGYINNRAEFWGASENNDNEAVDMELNSDLAIPLPGNSGKYHGYSVRCVRD
jgi:uncharacterized protein (TIGR02145 family)